MTTELATAVAVLKAQLEAFREEVRKDLRALRDEDLRSLRDEVVVLRNAEVQELRAEVEKGRERRGALGMAVVLQFLALIGGLLLVFLTKFFG